MFNNEDESSRSLVYTGRVDRTVVEDSSLRPFERPSRKERRQFRRPAVYATQDRELTRSLLLIDLGEATREVILLREESTMRLSGLRCN